jgi:calcium-dependent protein kinase
MVIDASVFGELESFMKSFTLKKVLLLRLASQIPETEVSTLKNIFKKIDANGNGLISMEEMVAGMKEFSALGMCNLKEKEVKRLFYAMDLDHNGEIGYTEFLASFMSSHLESNDRHLKAIFKDADVSGNGTLDKEEMRTILYGHGDHLNKEDDLEEVMKMADKNGDGEIDYEELIELMG